MCRLSRCLASTKTRTSKDPHLQGPGLWAQCPEWEAPAGRWEAALEADALAEAEELDAADAEVSVPQVLHPIHAPRHEMCRLQCAPRGMSLVRPLFHPLALICLSHAPAGLVMDGDGAQHVRFSHPAAGRAPAACLCSCIAGPASSEYITCVAAVAGVAGRGSRGGSGGGCGGSTSSPGLLCHPGAPQHAARHCPSGKPQPPSPPAPNPFSGRMSAGPCPQSCFHTCSGSCAPPSIWSECLPQQ